MLFVSVVLLGFMDRRVHGRGWEWSVTVRVTTLKGPSAGVYYVEQLPSYYLQAGEPRGVWLGHGAGTARPGRRGGRRRVPGGDGRDGPAPPGPSSGSPLRRHVGPRLRRHLLGAEVGVGAVGPRRRRTSAARCWPLTTPRCGDGRVDRGPRPHPVPDRRRGGGGGRRGDRGGGVPAAHQPGRRPAAAHPSGDRRTGCVTGRPLAGAGRPDASRRSADPLGPVPRRVCGPS